MFYNLPYFNLNPLGLKFIVRLSLFIVLAVAFPFLSCKTQSRLNSPTEMSMNEFQFDTYGEGSSAMILLHGLGSNKKAWKKIMPFLEKEYQIFALDFPKYLDTQDKTKVSIANYAELVKDFITALPQERVHVVGHSMGGQVAMHLSIHYPGLVESLILLAPAGLEQFSDADKKWFKTWVTKDYYMNLTDEAVKRSFDINFAGGALPEDARFMLEDRMALKNDSIAYSRYIDYVLSSINSMLEEPVYEDLSKLNAPSLVLFGADDQLIPNRILHPGLTVNEVLDKSEKIQSSKRILINEAGHFIQWDQAQEVARQINEFIANLLTKK